MEDKYVIFCKNDPNRPISQIDKLMNSHVMELSKDDAVRYVNEQNRHCGEGFYWCEKVSDWQKRLQSPQMNEFYERMDRLSEEMYKQLMEDDDIRNAVKKDYEERDKNINGFQIPFIADNNEDYEEKLKEKLSAFKKEINRPAFEKEGNLISDVNNICDKVIDAFDAVKSGKSKEAEKIVSEILEDYKKYPFAVSELDKCYAFRGIAPFEELRPDWGNENTYGNMLSGDLSFFRARVVKEKEKINELNEINYLPYSKRLLSKDMRFSSKGKVCLYLGTTSYVCSEECRWNKEDNLYLSSFKFNEKGKRLKILNLVVLQALINGMIPRDKDDLLQKDLHNSMIRIFPLVIATMFTIKTSDKDREEKYCETIKYEYLLSQVLMNVLQKEGIDGVAYLSRQGKDDFQYPQMVCLAIPVTGINSENEYGDLINCYEMTKPVLANDKMYGEKKSYINEKWPMYLKRDERENFNAKVYYEEQDIFYQETPFSKIDDHMVNLKYEKFDGKITWKKHIKESVRKLPRLWQSKDDNFANMFMGAGLFFLLSCICTILLLISNNENEIINCITKGFFTYFITFSLSLSFGFLAWGFYVNNSLKRLKNAVWVALPLLILISLCAILIGIPFLIISLIVGKIIEMRAKKIDNFINFMLMLAILTMALLFLLSPNLSFSFWAVQKISIELGTICGINVFTCILFLFITFCIFESFLVGYGLLLILKHRQKKLKKEHIKNFKKSLEEDIKNQKNESEEFIKEQIVNEEDKLDKINKRDIEYLWNGIKRIWLLILVIVFMAITFNVLNIEGIECYSSDIINVLTVYTLILLYYDKRKEWK